MKKKSDIQCLGGTSSNFFNTYYLLDFSSTRYLKNAIGLVMPSKCKLTLSYPVTCGAKKSFGG